MGYQRHDGVIRTGELDDDGIEQGEMLPTCPREDWDRIIEAQAGPLSAAESGLRDRLAAKCWPATAAASEIVRRRVAGTI